MAAVAPLVLRIELIGVEPLVWRRIAVPRDWTLAQLHPYLQWVMGWQDTHAHEFGVGDLRVAPDWWIREVSSPDDAVSFEDETTVKVSAALKRCASLPDGIEYLYDMGDGWRHRIVPESAAIARRARADWAQVCLAGENTCPPEDCGGPPGYAMFLTALRDAEDPEHDTYVNWIGGVFDPVGFDLNLINREWRTRQRREREPRG